MFFKIAHPMPPPKNASVVACISGMGSTTITPNKSWLSYGGQKSRAHYPISLCVVDVASSLPTAPAAPKVLDGGKELPYYLQEVGNHWERPITLCNFFNDSQKPCSRGDFQCRFRHISINDPAACYIFDCSIKIEEIDVNKLSQRQLEKIAKSYIETNVIKDCKVVRCVVQGRHTSTRADGKVLGFVHLTQPRTAVNFVNYLVSLGYKASTNGSPIKYSTGHVCPPCWKSKEQLKELPKEQPKELPKEQLKELPKEHDGWITHGRNRKPKVLPSHLQHASANGCNTQERNCRNKPPAKASASTKEEKEDDDLVLEENEPEDDRLMLEEQPDNDELVLEEQPIEQQTTTRRRVQWSDAVVEEVSASKFSWDVPSTRISVLPAGSKPADFPCLSPGTPKTVILDDLQQAIADSNSSLLTDGHARNAEDFSNLADPIELSSFEAPPEYTMSEEQAAWNDQNDDDLHFDDEDEEEDYVLEMMRQRLIALKRA